MRKLATPHPDQEYTVSRGFYLPDQLGRFKRDDLLKYTAELIVSLDISGNYDAFTDEHAAESFDRESQKDPFTQEELNQVLSVIEPIAVELYVQEKFDIYSAMEAMVRDRLR